MERSVLKELAKDLTSHPSWAWRAGMSTICGKVSGTLLEDSLDFRDDPSEEPVVFWIAHFSGPTKDGGGYRDELVPSDAIPDLSSPATIGCLLSLVRSAYKNKNLFAGREAGRDRWIVWDGETDLIGSGESEVEALVSAFLGRQSGR